MRALTLLFFLPLIGFSQVGINTTSPDALLDIQSSNQAAPTHTDGILIPKIDEYPSANPTAAQDGMLVFATGTGSVTKGFYYWDNTTTSWKPFSGTTIEKIDDLTDGRSDNNGSSIFLGVDAGVNDDETNNANIGIGYAALRDNIDGNVNTAIGVASLQNNTTGSRNSAFGYAALLNNNTGGNNSAFGSEALFNNTSGLLNTAIGHFALLQNTTGNFNAVLGFSALNSNIDGSGNVAIGNSAGSKTNGSNNVFLGSSAGSDGTDPKSGSVFIGYRAGYYENNSNRLYIENSFSTDPLIYGEFDNDLLRINGDLEVEKITDASITVKTPFGETSSLKLFESGGSGDYGFEFQYDGTPDKLFLWSRTFAGNEGIRMTWLKNGRVGINDTAPTALLDIEATNRATPINTDGILIPRIDAFPAFNPTAAQNGMLVFLTTDNTFYFWRNSATSWQKVNVERVNDLADGKSDNDGTDDGSSIFLGINAGTNDNETDNHNAGVGYYAMHFNTSGVANAALGSTALINNTSGSNNSAFGRRALYSSTTSSGNSAFGSQALEDNITGYSNSALGFEALTSNTTGYHNTAIGFETLESNTTGYYNTALGYEALRSNTIGHSNIAIGYESLELNTAGAFNTSIGYDALENNTTGSSNIALGYQALESNTNGFRNTAIGYNAILSNTNGAYNTALGYEALQSLDGHVTLQTAIFNTAVGYQASSNITTGSYNTSIGYNSGPTLGALSNTTALGYGAVPTTSNQVRLGNAPVSVIGGSANWSNLSDRRLKTNIKEDIAGLDFIKKLRPVSYNLDMDAIARFEKTPDSLRLRDAEQLKAKEIQTGFIAQEVEAAAKEVDFDFHGIVKPYNSEGTYALRYAEFVVPLVKAMQEQQDIIEAQKEELKGIRLELEEIKALLKKD